MSPRVRALRAFFRSIETGDLAGTSVISSRQYIQHNPLTAEGKVGWAELFARLAATDPHVRVLRIFEDGDYVFAHNEYDFSSVKAAFEVFRFEGDQAVEHWDNIQSLQGDNPAGRSMLDGPTELRDLDRTEANRALVQRYLERVHVRGDLDALPDFVAADLHQHSPGMVDGLEALRTSLRQGHLACGRVHRVLAQGNFVLGVGQGQLGAEETSVYLLYRLEEGRIVERWSTVEVIPPRALWKNDNGKF